MTRYSTLAAALALSLTACGGGQQKHHTYADTLDQVDPAQLRQGVAAMALVAWWLAESAERIDGR